MPSDFPKDVRIVVKLRKMANNKTEMTVTEYAEFGSISNFAQIGLEESMDKMIAIFLVR